MYLDKGKYHIRLDYEQPMEPLGIDRQVIVTDGSAIFHARFSKRTNPTGAEADILPASATLHTVGLGFNPARLEREHVDIDRLIENVGAEGINWEELPGRGFQGRYELKGGKTFGTFDVLDKFAYNIATRSTYVAGREQAVDKYDATWNKADGVWFVESLTNEMTVLPDGFQRYWRIHYQTFQVNIDVDPKLFTVDALEMPDGSRILDHRPGAKQRSYIYVRTQETNQAKLDNLLEQAERLPDMRIGPPSAQISPLPHRKVWWPWVLLLVGVLASATGMAVWRHKRGAPPT
jgi:hypothetical protein